MARYASLALLAASLAEAAASGVISQDLVFKTVSKDVSQAVAKLKGRTTTGSASLVSDQGFWFSNFTIGASPNLEILIDTGSSDAILNPGEYKPSKGSTNLNHNFTITYGTTNPDGSGTETLKGPIYKDIVSQHGTNLTVQQQAIGDAKSPTNPPPFPHNGLIGYAGIRSSALAEPPFIHSLCNQGSLAECRFGLALRTNKTGSLYYGEVASSEFDGPLAVSPLYSDYEWITRGDIAVNGKTIQSNQIIATDSGTTVIFGPPADVAAMLKAAGVQVVSSNNGTVVNGYYNCDKPPKLGFAFPSAAAAGKNGASANSTVFNVLPAALEESRNGTNCTASIHGSTGNGGGWLIGQAFFQGKYLDHNIAGNSMGFATLKSAPKF